MCKTPALRAQESHTWKNRLNHIARRPVGWRVPQCEPSEDFAGATPLRNSCLGTVMRHATSCEFTRMMSVEKLVHTSFGLANGGKY
jgi:hypothetical protein